jgi:electron transport complex protein RnfB
MRITYFVKQKYEHLLKYPRIGKAIATLFGAIEVPLLEAIRFIDSYIFSGLYEKSMLHFNRIYGSRIIPLNITLKNIAAISPTEEIMSIIRRVPSLGIGYCYCRATYRNCDNDLWTCIHIGTAKQLDEIRSKIPLQTASVLQVEKILNKAHRNGLVHQLITAPNPNYFYVICSCCPDCCVMLRNKINKNMPNTALASNFIAKQLNFNCVNCGKCVERCYFNAIKLIKGRIMFNPDNCLGCGLCVSSCEFDAIKLIRRKDNRSKNILFPLKESKN